jgi:hypothetical protein
MVGKGTWKGPRGGACERAWTTAAFAECFCSEAALCGSAGLTDLDVLDGAAIAGDAAGVGRPTDAGLAAVDDETGGSLALAGEGEGMGRSSRTASVTAGVDSWANTELSGAVEGTGSDATGGEGTGRRVVITVVEATYAAESGLVLTKTTKTPGESGTVITPQRLGALRPTFLMRSTGNVPEVE